MQAATSSRTEWLPGDGEFPMQTLREVFRAEYAGPVNLECERLWHPGLAPLDETLTAATQRGATGFHQWIGHAQGKN